MTHDIVVCGAGPAGSIAARRLAAAGARVVLVGAPPRPGCEGLSARSRSLLAEEGLDLGAGVIAGPLARRGIWADGRSVEGREWLVERSRLAEALRARARAAGADDRLGMVTSAERAGDGWRLRLRTGEVLATPLLIDARGRRGMQRRGPVLLAIGRRFRRREPGAAGTGIGATDAGWCWWAASGQMLWVQVVGSPRMGHPAGWVRAAAAQIPALARSLENAVAEGDPVARPAHAGLGAGGNDSTLWRVGDAAVGMDPLSGQGVYEAVRGARLAATAIQSVLNGGDALLAHRFIADRHDEAWLRSVRVAADFYRENAGRGAFWADTAAAYDALQPANAAAQSTDAAAPFEMTRVERRPVLDDGRIVERDVLVTPENPRGAWHIAGVPLVKLTEYLHRSERATIAGAALALDRPAAAVAAAIHWLRQRGAMPRRIPTGIR